MPPPTQQLIQNTGIFHGLPTYPDSITGLTALVTGANGISGYHLIKNLAASPQRWRKIYALSRRPPQDYFYDELGEGAGRVEHIAVDFLEDVERIVEELKGKGVRDVDYVSFFSYVQPVQKGGVLGMWEDAEALSEVNAKLLSNFLEALKLAKTTPKRFLLQTGAKHYGFHMGPATNPSFETDPRVMLEPNFYYPQEDLLVRYCEDTGASWNVVRPSYIIGAVRDNTLNFLPGLAIYAAVQANLGKPLLFPGDYVAWDKEVCQSSATLNAYFEEWTVLTDDAANEAFNIHDGLNFTWGRFWPYLASWYGLSWEPPSLDERTYTTTVTRHDQSPRGYGQAITRTSFSLQAWSESTEVVDAWAALKTEHNLDFDPFEDRAKVFGITDSAILGGWPLSTSLRKARRFGFHGTVDSYESIFETLKVLAKMRVVVPMVKAEFEA